MREDNSPEYLTLCCLRLAEDIAAPILAQMRPGSRGRAILLSALAQRFQQEAEAAMTNQPQQTDTPSDPA